MGVHGGCTSILVSTSPYIRVEIRRCLHVGESEDSHARLRTMEDGGTRKGHELQATLVFLASRFIQFTIVQRTHELETFGSMGG